LNSNTQTPDSIYNLIVKATDDKVLAERIRETWKASLRDAGKNENTGVNLDAMSFINGFMGATNGLNDSDNKFATSID
jgi:hypothetical protein